MQQVGHTVMMPDERPGVTVPAELARPLAAAALLGLADYARRNGGPVGVAPRLRDLIAALAASAAADLGSPLATMNPSLITVSEAAETAGVSERRIRQLCASGRLRCQRPGWAYLIERASAEDYGRERRCRTR